MRERLVLKKAELKNATPKRAAGARVVRMLLLLVALLMVFGGSLAWSIAPAEQGKKLVVRDVDATEFPKVSMTVLPPGLEAGAVEVKENGKVISTKSAPIGGPDSGRSLATIFIFDTSESAQDQDAITKMKSAIAAYASTSPANERIGIVASGGAGRVVARASDDKNAVIQSMSAVAVSDKNALWNGLQLAGMMLSEEKSAVRQVIVLTTSGDSFSPQGTLESATQALRDQGAALFSVGVKSRNELPTKQLEALAKSSGGRLTTSDDASSFATMVDEYQRVISGQQVLSYTSALSPKADDRSLSYEVSLSGQSALAKTAQGMYAQGEFLNPTVVSDGKQTIFGSSIVLVVVGIGIFIAVGLLIWMIVDVAGRPQDSLLRALRPYSGELPTEERDISKLADSELMKRAVAKTEELVKRRGLFDALEIKLQQADLPLRPAEAVLFAAIAALIAMLLGFILMGFIGIFFAALLFVAAPFVVLNFLGGRRRRRFNSQLPDTLQLLSGSLRAGYSFVQGLDAVAKQTEAPMSTELTRAISEARLGRPMEDSLDDVGKRMRSEDFEWAVMAIKIQREVGGNLAELLVTVAETMIARERLRREVLALTAEGRMSAIILAFLPFAIGLIIMVMNPEYMDPLLKKTLGQIVLALAVGMIALGYYLMNKLIKIEV